MKFFNFQFLLLIFSLFFFTGKGRTQSFDKLILFQKKAGQKLTFKKGKILKILCDICDKPILIGNLKGKKAENIFLESLDKSNIRGENVILKIPIRGVQSIEYYSRFKDSKRGKELKRVGNFLIIASSIGILASMYPSTIIADIEGAIQPLNKISWIGFGLGFGLRLGISIFSTRIKFTVGGAGKWYIP